MILRRKCYFYTALLLVISVNLVQSQFAETLIENPCIDKMTCQDCMQTKSCAWCLQPDFGDKSRCFQPNLSPLVDNCPQEYIYNPDNVEMLNETVPLTRGSSATGGSSESSTKEFPWSSQNENEFPWTEQNENKNKIVQIYPQSVKLQLRISMFYAHFTNYFQIQKVIYTSVL